MINPVKILYPELKELLKEKNFPLLKEVLRECSPLGLLDLWADFTEEERLQIFRLLTPKAALKLFEILDTKDQQHLLGKLEDENLSVILEGMNSPDLVKIFHKIPPRAVRKMTNLIKLQESLSRIDLVMQFPPNSAGSLMHPEFIHLDPKLTAHQVIVRLEAIARPNQKDHLFALFVCNGGGKPVGAVRLQDLFAAPAGERLSEIMTSVEPYKIAPEMDQEDVSKLFLKYHLDAAPVVDAEGKLIGVITLKDILPVERLEATEDIVKMAGTRAIDLRETSVFRTIAYRMPWLVVTLFGELLVSLVIKSYEPVLAKVIALASFSPLISAMGGNVGSQSATIVVRSLALGEIRTKKDQLKTVFHEAQAGIAMGLFYGLLLGGIAYLLYGSRYHWEFGLAVVVGMATSISVASTMGAIEPMFFHRIGVDPATATGPLITTITDIISNITYFSFATFMLLR